MKDAFENLERVLVALRLLARHSLVQFLGKGLEARSQLGPQPVEGTLSAGPSHVPETAQAPIVGAGNDCKHQLDHKHQLDCRHQPDDKHQLDYATRAGYSMGTSPLPRHQPDPATARPPSSPMHCTCTNNIGISTQIENMNHMCLK